VFWNSVIAPDLDKINLVKELLSVKSHKGQISLFCESEVDFMIWFLCTFCVFLYVFFFSHCVFICVPSCTNFIINKLPVQNYQYACTGHTVKVAKFCLHISLLNSVL